MGGGWKREIRREERARRPLPGAGGAHVTLEPGELAFVTRTIVGLGGMQGLLLQIVRKVRGDGRLELTADEVRKVRAYAADYGPGGYQDRFRAIVAALDRELADPDARGNR